MKLKGRQSTNIEDDRGKPMEPDPITNENNPLQGNGDGWGGAPMRIPVPTPRPDPNSPPRSPTQHITVTPGDWKAKNKI